MTQLKAADVPSVFLNTLSTCATTFVDLSPGLLLDIPLFLKTLLFMEHVPASLVLPKYIISHLSGLSSICHFSGQHVDMTL